MAKTKLSILTNMVAPYRVPFFKALAADPTVQSLRVLTCVEREVDRQWQVEKEAGYSVNVLPGFTLNLRRGTDAMRILHFRIGIFWELLRHRPDTLVIGDASWTSFLAALACRVYGIRYVVWNEITTSSQVSKGLVARIRRWMYRGAHQLIASCGMAKDFLLQNGVPAEKIHIVLNAVDNDYFLQQRALWEPQRDALRAELGVAPDAFCFIYVGQLISRKRVVETVELLAQVAPEQPVHLLIAGTGPLEGAMRSAAARHEFQAITFCGYAEPARLSQLYVAADALILLSEDEPWGMVVNECLLFGNGYFTSTSVAAGVELQSDASHLVKPYTDVKKFDLQKLISACSGLKGKSPSTPPSECEMASAFLKYAK
ncbi:probable glycosyl transferase, group 1 [gamma proteobacterium HdN1]|nr:probable glycosyl transferase, group 1 [gamma proteobacterium HdN1]